MLPVPLLSVQMGLWEEAVYTGAEDGRVFEIGLLGGQEGDFKKASPHLSSTTSLGDKECRVLLGHTGAVNSLAMTSHGHNLLSGMVGGLCGAPACSLTILTSFRKMTVKTRAKPTRIEHNELNYCLKLLSSWVEALPLLQGCKTKAPAKLILAGSQDSTVRIWDVQSRQAVWVIQAKGPITALLVLPETSSSETGIQLAPRV